MFTGIIEETGEVLGLAPGDAPGITVLTLRAGDALAGLEDGASLAVDGVCLTATAADEPGVFRADLMDETIARTALGELKAGEAVNLERCTRADGRLDGHIVQGHVDAVAPVLAVDDHGGWTTLRFGLAPELSPLGVEKGSIAVAGVSLTVTGVSAPGEPEAWFEVGIIPTTAARTTLGSLAVGDRVNIETDVIAKHVQRLAATAVLTKSQAGHTGLIAG